MRQRLDVRLIVASSRARDRPCSGGGSCGHRRSAGQRPVWPPDRTKARGCSLAFTIWTIGGTCRRCPSQSHHRLKARGRPISSRESGGGVWSDLAPLVGWTGASVAQVSGRMQAGLHFVSAIPPLQDLRMTASTGWIVRGRSRPKGSSYVNCKSTPNGAGGPASEHMCDTRRGARSPMF